MAAPLQGEQLVSQRSVAHRYAPLLSRAARRAAQQWRRRWRRWRRQRRRRRGSRRGRGSAVLRRRCWCDSVRFRVRSGPSLLRQSRVQSSQAVHQRRLVHTALAGPGGSPLRVS